MIRVGVLLHRRIVPLARQIGQHGQDRMIAGAYPKDPSRRATKYVEGTSYQIYQLGVLAVRGGTTGKAGVASVALEPPLLISCLSGDDLLCLESPCPIRPE